MGLEEIANAMISYYERYVRGELVPVWEELSQLDEAVFAEPLHADALDVARETMRRARATIVLLQQRLRALGYRFGVTHLDPATCFWLEDEMRSPPPYTPAPADAEGKVAALEAARGRLPLSFRAWLEHIESVNFVGMFVGTSADSAIQATTGTMGEAQASESHDVLSHEAPTRSLHLAGEPASHALPSEVVQFMRAHPDRVDPFWYWPSLPTWHELLHHMTPGTPYDVTFSPDAPVKGGEPGGIGYQFVALTASADAWVESERWRMRFVPYLRHCLLEWGGFPGIGEYAGLPSSVMAPLTSGLTPF